MFVLGFQDVASCIDTVAQQSGLGLSIAISGATLAAFLGGGTESFHDIQEINDGAAFGTSLGRQGSADTVTFTLSGATTDNGSATFPSDTQVTLSGYDDTLNFTGSNDAFSLADANGDNLGNLTLSGNATVTVGQNGNISVDGDGNNVFKSNIVNLQIDLGTGNDVVGDVAEGTVVNALPSGQNSFIASNDEIITG